FFRGWVIDWKCLIRLAVDPLAVDVHLISANLGLNSAWHEYLQLAFLGPQRPMPLWTPHDYSRALVSAWTDESPVPTGTASGVFSRPYPKKKNTANAIKPKVIPNILTSYFHNDVICLAGKNATMIASVVVSSPATPANMSVPLLYTPPCSEPRAANFTRAANTYRNGTNCNTTAAESIF